MASIYVACLASYNAGHLHGRWIEVTDAEDMQADIAEMLRESPFPNVMVPCPECPGAPDEGDLVCSECGGTGEVPSAEEWAIHDYDGLPSSFGEHPDLDLLVAYADAAEQYGEPFRLWWQDQQRNAVDVDAFLEQYAGTFESEADWAEQFVADTGLLANVPETVARYFDFDAYARDARLGGDIWTARGESGLHVFWSN